VNIFDDGLLVTHVVGPAAGSTPGRPRGMDVMLDSGTAQHDHWRALRAELLLQMAVGTATVRSEPGGRLEDVSQMRIAPMFAGKWVSGWHTTLTV